VRTGGTLESIARDVAYGARTLAKRPGFTTVAVATLALGLGSSTAMFSVVDTVVFRPLPYRDPGRLFKICLQAPQQARCDDNAMSLADLLDLRQQSRTFQEIAADDGDGVQVRHADGSRESVDRARVTMNWLSTLGVRPAVGHDFAPQEDRPERDHVVIVGNDYWHRRFAADPGVVGKTLVVDDEPCTVIGVLPPNVLRYGADLLMPLVPADYTADRGHRDLDAFGRLAPGVSPAEARVEIETIARRLEQEYPVTNRERRGRLYPLGKYYASIQPKADPTLVLVLGAVGLVLLIACANVAGLLLARAATRRRECLVRAALGASRGRLVRQLLIENLLLFAAGGLLGVLAARGLVDSLAAFAVAGGYVPERMTVAIDGRVLAFGLLLSLATGAVFGYAPALQASRVDLSPGLGDAGRTLVGRRPRSRARRALVVSQLALSLVLLVGFGLLARSFARVYAASGGFDPENLVVIESDGGRSFPEAVAFWRTALEHARTVPGVKSAALTSRPPVHHARQRSFTVEGPGRGEGAAGDVLVSAGYFKTMGIPLVGGRAFTERDDGAAPPVVIVSENLARRLFGEADPIGRRLMLEERGSPSCCAAAGLVEGVWREIVGVVGNVRQGNLDEAPAMTIYRPYTQIVEHDMYLVARAGSAADVAPIAAHLRSHLLAATPARDWSNPRPMREIIRQSESIRLRRFVLTILGGFAVVALLLAALGVYGVITYSVTERTAEIGVRMAMGATRPVVFGEVLGEAASLVCTGLALGIMAALVLTRLIASMLFDVHATDAATYLSVCALLVGFVLFAACLPARRATRLDPIAALRHE
jgi:putative ABC transport system permease protein